MFSKISLSSFSKGLILSALVSVCSYAQAQEIDASLASAAPGSSAQPFSEASLSAKAKGSRTAAIVFHRKTTGRARANSFVGTWVSTLTRSKNTCSATSTPTKLTVGLRIDGALNGTDIGDGSPFFTGRVLAANKIGFARSRTINGCTQTQIYVLGNVSGNNAATAIQSDTTCGAQSCTTLFVGNSKKR